MTAPHDVGAVSTVSIPAIQRIVGQAFSAPPPSRPAKPAPSAKSSASSAVKAPAQAAPTALPAAKVTVDVINNGAPQGTAGKVLAALAARGYTAGRAGDPPAGTPAQSLTTVSYGAGAAVNAAAIAKYFGPDTGLTPTTSLAAGRVLVTLGVATQAVPAPLASSAPASSAPASSAPASSAPASSGPASSASAPAPGTSRSAASASGAAPALTPQEKQWAAEAKAKYGIPCVY
jgi:hypothetical protein